MTIGELLDLLYDFDVEADVLSRVNRGSQGQIYAKLTLFPRDQQDINNIDVALDCLLDNGHDFIANEILFEKNKTPDVEGQAWVYFEMDGKQIVEYQAEDAT